MKESRNPDHAHYVENHVKVSGAFGIDLFHA